MTKVDSLLYIEPVEPQENKLERIRESLKLFTPNFTASFHLLEWVA